MRIVHLLGGLGRLDAEVYDAGRATLRCAFLMPMGELLTEHNFAPDPAEFMYQLRRVQDEQLGMEK